MWTSIETAVSASSVSVADKRAPRCGLDAAMSAAVVARRVGGWGGMRRVLWVARVVQDGGRVRSGAWAWGVCDGCCTVGARTESVGGYGTAHSSRWCGDGCFN